MIYAYLRVSTDDQDEQNQRVGVDELAARMGWHIDEYIVDAGVSGTTDPRRRNLGKLLRRATRDDIIICSELSRLGRKLFMIMEILNLMMSRGVRLYTVKDGYTLGDNITSKVLAFAFGLVAEIERDLISQRTREALARRKAAGQHIGRQFGCRNRVHKMDDCADSVLRAIARGRSVASIARRHRMSPTTIFKWLAEQNMTRDDIVSGKIKLPPRKRQGG